MITKETDTVSRLTTFPTAVASGIDPVWLNNEAARLSKLGMVSIHAIRDVNGAVKSFYALTPRIIGAKEDYSIFTGTWAFLIERMEVPEDDENRDLLLDLLIEDAQSHAIQAPKNAYISFLLAHVWDRTIQESYADHGFRHLGVDDLMYWPVPKEETAQDWV